MIRCQTLSEEILSRLESQSIDALLENACAVRREVHGNCISYSRKVFIPLTRLCRNVCGYCTFVRGPKAVDHPYLRPAEVLEIARLGRDAGCQEALFTLGDRPETVHAAARSALQALGYESTVDYLADMCALVLNETGLLPHVNAGVLHSLEAAKLRAVSVSQGIMLESVSARLCGPGGPHFGSPDKVPFVRLAAIEAAGRLAVPFTTGILIGIGETRLERIEALLTIREIQERYGHIQEVIVQNFLAKDGTRMGGAVEPDFSEIMWTAAAARIVLGSRMNIQVPPNLSNNRFAELLAAGINDWGGISPVTDDYVNPERPWPQIDALERATRAAGLVPVERLAIYPSYAVDADKWLDRSLRPHVLRASDSEGYARRDAWSPGLAAVVSPTRETFRGRGPGAERLVDGILRRARAGSRLTETEIARLFAVREGEVGAVLASADEVRARVCGNTVRYVVNRNINYTNICSYRCRFCAFSKGKTSSSLRGQPYELTSMELDRRVREAWSRGATEVCMQGGIHPTYDGSTYLGLLRTAKSAQPGIHVHAFSPLEISHGARTLGITIEEFLCKLRDDGLGSLPGTAAEILDDDVRARICPDKLTVAEWLAVVRTAHKVGLRTTATIMFGHVETPTSWARHLLQIRDLQEETAGFTEFVPLPFVHMEAPMYLREGARKGPTWRETVLMHAVSRLVLHPLISNIQVSWVKLGPDEAAACLEMGVNDLGGTLMNESISRAAGTQHGQELPPTKMEALIASHGRRAEQRTTLYGAVDAERHLASFAAPALKPVVQGLLARV